MVNTLLIGLLQRFPVPKLIRNRLGLAHARCRRLRLTNNVVTVINVNGIASNIFSIVTRQKGDHGANIIHISQGQQRRFFFCLLEQTIKFIKT